jgi:hypothetical protein
MKNKLTPAQRKAFEGLTWTYVSAMEYFETMETSSVPPPAECESRYGVGHLKARRTMLLDTLNACDADLDAVYKALQRARRMCDSATLGMKVIDTYNEHWRDLLVTRRQLTKWLRCARLTARALNFSAHPGNVSRAGWLANWISNACQDEITNNPHLKHPKDLARFVESMLQNMPVEMKIDVLLNDRLMRLKPVQPTRRDKAGRTPQPWIRRAHAELRAAGVTNIENRKQLLVAVGLMPRRELERVLAKPVPRLT